MSIETLEVNTTNYILEVTNGTTQTLEVTEGVTLDLLLSEMGLQGPAGPAGKNISSVVKTSTVGLVDTYTITFSDSTTQTFTVTNGTNGRGIVSITRTSGTGAAGTTDTYTISYTDSTTSTFTVYNGANGTGSVSSVALSVPTGLSVTGSPITTSGTLAVTYSAGYSIPTTAKQGDWDTAYGWGNHALAGYLTNAAIGSTVQAYDADLTTWASIAPSTKQDAQSVNGIVKSSGTTRIAAVAGTDYVAPGGALGTPSSGNLSNCTADGTSPVGFRNIPQNSKSANYTCTLADAGDHILHPSADTTARTFTIPANSSVAYPIGTTITFVNQNGAGVLTIAITSDTMRLAGAGTTGSRTLAANGVATTVKVDTTEWIISGVGLT